MFLNTPIYQKNSPILEKEILKNTPILNSSYISFEKSNSNIYDNRIKTLKFSFSKVINDKENYNKYSPLIKTHLNYNNNELFENFEKKRSKSEVLNIERVKKKLFNRKIVKTIKIKFTPKLKVKKKKISFYMRKKIRNCLIKWIQNIKGNNYFNFSFSNNQEINYFSEEKSLKYKYNNDYIVKDLLPSFDKEFNDENIENKIIEKVVKYKNLNFMNSKNR